MNCTSMPRLVVNASLTLQSSLLRFTVLAQLQHWFIRNLTHATSDSTQIKLNVEALANLLTATAGTERAQIHRVAINWWLAPDPLDVNKDMQNILVVGFTVNVICDTSVSATLTIEQCVHCRHSTTKTLSQNLLFSSHSHYSILNLHTVVRL